MVLPKDFDDGVVQERRVLSEWDLREERIQSFSSKCIQDMNKFADTYAEQLVMSPVYLNCYMFE